VLTLAATLGGKHARASTLRFAWDSWERLAPAKLRGRTRPSRLAGGHTPLPEGAELGGGRGPHTPPLIHSLSTIQSSGSESGRLGSERLEIEIPAGSSPMPVREALHGIATGLVSRIWPPAAAAGSGQRSRTRSLPSASVDSVAQLLGARPQSLLDRRRLSR
jgi:hypothetical protein